MKKFPDIKFLAVSILLVLQIFLSTPPIIGVSLLCVWFFLGAQKSSLLFKESPLQKIYGHLSLFITSSLVFTLLFFFPTYTETSTAIGISVLSIILSLIESPKNCFRFQISKSPVLFIATLTYLLTLSTSLLLLFQARTGTPISSPWTQIDPLIFILFGFSTLLLLLITRLSKKNHLILHILYFGLAFWVSAIVIKEGFGFDPFLHRAAQTAIAETGTIDPKQILYAGQYAIVTAIHFITHTSIFWIDVLLLPILAAVSIPSILIKSLKHGWKLSNSTAKLTPIFLLSPFMALTFTVPNNIAFLLFIWTIFLLPFKQIETKKLLAALSLLTLLIHPIAGALSFILLGISLLELSPISKKITTPISFLIAIIGTPLLFVLYQIQKKNNLTLLNPFERIDYFLGLFKDPFVHDHFPIPLFWQIIYHYRTFTPIILLSIGIVALVVLRKKIQNSASYLIFITGTLISIFLVSTLFIFEDIIYYEQTEFAARMLQMTVISTIPLLFVVLDKFKTKLSNPKHYLPLFIFISIFSPLAWYFSYPQLNPKSINVGQSVSSSDIKAVHFIEKIAPSNHIVLSNQMTSGAAIQELGFRRYHQTDRGKALWYAIPTGGKLYEHFIETTYRRPQRSTIVNAATFAQTEHVYVLVHNYHPYFDIVRDSLAIDSDDTYNVDDQISIFYYHFPTYGDTD